MGAAYFYHITQRPLVETLRMLLHKALQSKWRVAVRGTDDTQLSELNRALWLGPEETFLPHGLANGPDAPLQPVLLTREMAAANDPVCVMSVGGAEVKVDEVRALQRVCVLFDGNDPEGVSRARVQWKTLADAGASAQYWAEDTGRWIMKAET
ncbi:MAG: DNA polymerase III subunit chi [Pseudomonadota bacterium]